MKYKNIKTMNTLFIYKKKIIYFEIKLEFILRHFFERPIPTFL